MPTLDEILPTHNQGVGMEGFLESLTKNKTGRLIADAFSRAYNNEGFVAIRNRIADILPGEERYGFTPTPPLGTYANEWLNRASYMDLKPVKFYSPVGLKVTVLEYISELEEIAPYMARLESDLLKPTTDLLATILNNPSFLKSASGRNINSDFLKFTVDQFSSRISKCFEKDGHSDMAPFGTLYKRNEDVFAAYNAMNKLEVAVIGKGQSIKAVAETSERIFELAEQLVINMRDDPLYSEMHETISKHIAGLLHTCALWVEFFAVYIRQITVLRQALTDNNKKMKDLSKIK